MLDNLEKDIKYHMDKGTNRPVAWGVFKTYKWYMLMNVCIEFFGHCQELFGVYCYGLVLDIIRDRTGE
jgi:hypothetical protein